MFIITLICCYASTFFSYHKAVFYCAAVIVACQTADVAISLCGVAFHSFCSYLNAEVADAAAAAVDVASQLPEQTDEMIFFPIPRTLRFRLVHLQSFYYLVVAVEGSLESWIFLL